MSDPTYSYGYGAPPVEQTEDKTMAIVVYALFLGGYFSGGLSPVLGIILAYVSRTSAGPMMATHFAFQIRTFWLSIAVGLFASVITFAGALAVHVSPVLGLFVFLGALLMLAQTIWFVVRCIIGLIKASQDEPYPNPTALLV